MIFSRAAALPLLLLLAALAAAPPSAAGEVVAVLSGAPGPYQTALEGFVKEFGGEVPTVRLPDRVLPAGTRVIVAFGGQAAVERYPEGAVVIVCLAPGLRTRPRHRGPFVHVTMKPPARKLLMELLRLQPGMKRLAVLSHGLDTKGYAAELRRSGAALGVAIIAPSVSGRDEVPAALRAAFKAGANAIWLAPDPLLVTPETFQTIKQFSWDNGLPFYAPSRGLAVAGAAAAVSVSPAEQGRETALLARRALARERLPEFVYPERTEITVNLESALKAGLVIRPEALAKDVEVIR